MVFFHSTAFRFGLRLTCTISGSTAVLIEGDSYFNDESEAASPSQLEEEERAARMSLIEEEFRKRRANGDTADAKVCIFV